MFLWLRTKAMQSVTIIHDERFFDNAILYFNKKIINVVI
ncbi:hypothetical protein DSUL_140042 [Desulfovibrionales bacterium]